MERNTAAKSAEETIEHLQSQVIVLEGVNNARDAWQKETEQRLLVLENENKSLLAHVEVLTEELRRRDTLVSEKDQQISQLENSMLHAMDGMKYSNGSPSPSTRARRRSEGRWSQVW